MMQREFLIVVADDDLDDQDLIKEALKDSSRPVTVHAVYDGVQLLDYLLLWGNFKNRTFANPDVIFLDLNMPLMDGFQAIRQIRSYPHLKGIPIYVITTSNSEDERKKALELGATGFYRKGASSREIRRVVQEVCLECFNEMNH